MTTTGTIILVEDDLALAREVVEQFGKLSLNVEHVADGEEGLRRILRNDYILAILDVMLPGRNGFDICREARAAKPMLPILLATSLDTETNKVLGLELGADDYIVKPFSHAELIARVRSKLRRQSEYLRMGVPAEDSNDGLLQIGDLSIDSARRIFCIRGESVQLTAKEFDFVFFLMSHPGRVFTRLDLLRSVWGVDVAGYEEAVISLVRRLRRKIEADSENPTYLKTVRGIGYSFAEPREFAGADDSSDE